MTVSSNAAARASPLPIFAAALVGVQVGAATVASRFALAELDPTLLGLLRYFVGVLCLVPFVAAAGGMPRMPLRDAVPMAVLGIVQFALLIWLFNVALTHLPAARVALIFSAFPLLTMVFAAALGRERLTPWRTLGVMTTMLGVGLVLGERLDEGGSSWLGEAAALGAAACGALCSVLYRPYLLRYPALPVSILAMAASVAALLVPALAVSGLGPVAKLSWRGWAATLFIGASSGVGYFTLMWAYARASPTRVAVFQALAPLTAAALGWAFLGEMVSATFGLGLCAVAAGIVLAHRA